MLRPQHLDYEQFGCDRHDFTTLNLGFPCCTILYGTPLAPEMKISGLQFGWQPNLNSAWMLSSLPKKCFGKSPDYDCGLDQGTVSHLVYGYPNFDAIRKEFLPENLLSLALLDLAVNLKAKTGVKTFLALFYQSYFTCLKRSFFE
ncbi:hypothetical protein AVEN_33172-1 [Araneus ventricosus]|uniref:Uncharacterized protein n=1 Tax=Araneus ventricosus TaxID=182803 RepID=A0A4Y2VI53_ARAVE|nr:hypothetical protein AVEN_33172-1 [Araneus ventricosus]